MALPHLWCGPHGNRSKAEISVNIKKSFVSCNLRDEGNIRGTTLIDKGISLTRFNQHPYQNAFLCNGRNPLKPTEETCSRWVQRLKDE